MDLLDGTEMVFPCCERVVNVLTATHHGDPMFKCHASLHHHTVGTQWGDRADVVTLPASPIYRSTYLLLSVEMRQLGCHRVHSLCVVVVGGYCSLRVEGSDVCGSLALEQTLSLMGLRYFPQPCGDFGRREGKAQLVLDVHADGGGDDVGVVGVDRRKEKLCTSVCRRIDLVESPLALQRIEHHPRDLRFAR